MGWLIKGVLDFLWEKLVAGAQLLFAWIYKLMELSKKRKIIDEKAKQSVEPLKNAKTKEEIDAAADKALDDL